jgi:hypothetical protein
VPLLTPHRTGLVEQVTVRRDVDPSRTEAGDFLTRLLDEH